MVLLSGQTVVLAVVRSVVTIVEEGVALLSGQTVVLMVVTSVVTTVTSESSAVVEIAADEPPTGPAVTAAAVLLVTVVKTVL